MLLKILAIGDIVGLRAASFLRENIWKIRENLSADAVIANGENINDIKGISPDEARSLLGSGIDLITTGNHIWDRRDIYPFLDSERLILRPANFPPEAPGCGYTVIDICSYRFLCINAMGTMFIDSLENPFSTVEKILRSEEGLYDFALLDFHAEATSEKIAMALNFDGRINIIWGTHTHVQTADETVLPSGTGYITDLGMTGPSASILGADPSVIIERFKTHLPQRLIIADSETVICGALFTLDTESGRCVSVKRVRLAEDDLK
ncbi:MAG: TIGR00282 family metallophosphoesterase [Clostridia bacterium]|nr:TIGR00282 family metallophosphoesterase [Clostridia bacterium]